MSWSFVQIAQTDASSAGTISKAFASSNTKGNSVVVVSFWDDTTSNPTVTDSNNNLYKQVGATFRAPGFGGSAQIWIASNIAGGANTVSLNGPGAFPLIHALEYSGLLYLPGYSRTGADVASGPSPGTVSISPIGNRDLLIGSVYPFNDDCNGPAPNCTQRGGSSGVNTVSFVADRLPVPNMGLLAVGCTFNSANENYICIGAAFQASGQMLRGKMQPMGL